VLAQIGHTDPAFTLRRYTHETQREDGEEQRLRALVDGAEWALSATNRVGSDAPRGEEQAA
jgi:hypothetical protein